MINSTSFWPTKAFEFSTAHKWPTDGRPMARFRPIPGQFLDFFINPIFQNSSDTVLKSEKVEHQNWLTFGQFMAASIYSIYYIGIEN